MPAKKEIAIPADKLALYNKLIATLPEIERKGRANPYTSHNGRMFTFLSHEGVMGIRLPEKERELFMKKYKTGLIKSYGVVLKEYAEVPGSLLKKTAELLPYLEVSYDYMKTLKPKPTKKK